MSSLPDHFDALIPSNIPEFRPEMAFPLLTEDMMERMRAYGKEEKVSAGQELFRRGMREVDMLVVLEGSVEISTLTYDNQKKVLHVLNRLEFSGEIDQLNTQRTLVFGHAITDCTLLRITRKDLRRLMRAEGDIANLIMQATIWRRLGIVADGSIGVTLYGHSDEAATVELTRFLIRNTYPHRLVVPLETMSADNLPAVVLSDGRVLARPTISMLADELGINELPDPHIIYDVAVVGAGPSGLAAAVYAASEGLSTLLIDGLAAGGQAATSSKIENYLGFPTGISGQRLAQRAQMQALKFGVKFAISREVISVEPFEGVHRLRLAGGIEACCRSVVVATGARYRTLDVENYSQFENQGVYYAATAMESLLCAENEVIVVGAGNSAGQAAVFLSGIARHVHLIVRGHSLARTMSDYLVSRIETSSRVTVYTESEIEALIGERTLESVTWLNRKTGERITRAIGAVFVMIGAEPNSGWLFGTVQLDRKGFVVTGGDEGFEMTPYATSMSGIYAVGDVRAKSVKRVASAVGEGSVVISDVHRYLADPRSTPADPQSVLAALQSASKDGNVSVN